ncbi:MAG: triose-phosphate isomerase [Bacteroidales bacterium]|jgi:triosephosphate isomerase|nr:triose-phosphate isomerase [Bacteroidales bacterium]
MRKKIIAGNWKMNLGVGEGYRLAGEILRMLGKRKDNDKGVILCTPYIHLKGVSDILNGSGMGTGAQNCSDKIDGALTGEISATMILSTGAQWVIIGHSERRTLFGEDDALLFRKTNAALDAGLSVIFCCGEVLNEREKGIHFETVRRQLTDGLFGLPATKFGKVVIAYEPVWAIGSGITASPAQAQEMHRFIRKLIAEAYNEPTAGNTTILYGGSCKSSNAAELFAGADVDGGLIGGASLKATEFCAIVGSLK